MSQRNLDLFERRPALVSEFCKGAAHVVGRERCAQLHAVRFDDFVDEWGLMPWPVIRSPLFTPPSTSASEKPALASHCSTAALAQEGMGTVRIRFPFPARSTMHQRPSRCWISSMRSPASSCRRRPAYKQREQRAVALALGFRVG